MPARARSNRNLDTRDRLLDTAERMFAEHGVAAISNRQIAEAAGQGNNAVVGYHFGTKSDLIRAAVRRRSGEIEELRAEMVARTEGSTEVRDWVACVVHPSVRHLEAQGRTSWYARFAAQVATDPALRAIMFDEATSAPSSRHILDRLHQCLPALPVGVRLDRADINRHLIVHVLAERERALADGTAQGSWDDTAAGLVDALVGVWLAPVSPRLADGAHLADGSTEPP